MNLQWVLPFSETGQLFDLKRAGDRKLTRLKCVMQINSDRSRDAGKRRGPTRQPHQRQLTHCRDFGAPLEISTEV